MDTEGLSIICAGLGSIEEDDDGNRIGYSREEYCLDNLKDLLRFLRRDDPDTRDVFKQVCKWNIVGKDLIPIIEHCQDDRNLVLNAVKVLVFLTMPVEASSKDVNEQLEYLWNIKSAITFSEIIAVIISLLEKPLENLECKAFTEDDWKLVQLVLTLFRNILAVQDISVQQKATGSANLLLSLRDDFLERLFRENVMDIILIINQHVGGSCRYLRHDNLLLLEIYHYIFMGQDPELIGKACLEDSKEEAKSCVESLKSIMQEEAEKRKLTRLRAGRHSQFSGAFTRLTLDGSKTMCKGTPDSASCDKLLKPEKVHRGPSKRLVKDYSRTPTTKRSILELLHDFLNQFLTGGYNVLMQSIAEDIEKEHHSIQISDVLMFFQLTQFVTSFQYHKFVMTKSNAEFQRESSVSDDDDDSTWFKGEMCGPIAATMNESMFELVIAKWHIAFDNLKETKNNAFLSIAGSLMKIMIRMLDLVLKLMPEKSKEPQTARIILYKLFYDQTDQGLTQFLLNMIRSFDAHKQPKSDLADLVEIVHVVIRLMEKLQAHGTLRVSKKARKARKKKTDDLKNTENGNVGDDDAVEIPSFSSENPSPNLNNNGMESSTPKDSDQKNENVNVSVQVDEVETSTVKSENSSGRLPQGEDRESKKVHDNFVAQGDDCDLSADEQPTTINEVDFKITSLLVPLASSSIISNLCWLLKFYKSNSLSTNHYVLSLLKRICDDLDLAPMLYQLSCLVIFYEILNEQKACPQKDYENIVHFLTGLVRRMLRKMKSQPLLFVDVLFWKTRKDCHHINLDTIHVEVDEMKKEVRSWGYAREPDLSQSQGMERTRKSLADALGDDEYDVTISNERHSAQNEDLDEVVGEKVLKTDSNRGNNREEHLRKGDFEGVIKRKRRLVLNDKLEEKIRGLYETYKDNVNCNQLIAEALDPEGNISPMQVSHKCKKLGLQLPSKSSVKGVHASKGNDQFKEGATEINSQLPSLNHPDESSLLRKPTNTRKRVRALNENQELQIRSLFEQFKDHRRCSHMIAKELDPDGGVTAAQVSRKLKKLGLRTSRMSTEVNRRTAHDEVDASTDDEEDSDNLTLSLLAKRRKTEDASLSSKELEHANDEMKSPGHSSDDELLSSVLQKSKGHHSKGEHKHTRTSVKQVVNGQYHENQLAQGLGESSRDERWETADTDDNVDVPRLNRASNSSEEQATETSNSVESSLLLKQPKHEDSGNKTLDIGDSPEIDATVNNSREHIGLTFDNDGVDDVQNVHDFTELEDSGDEQVPRASSPKNSAKRRKLRVVDFDDDE